MKYSIIVPHFNDYENISRLIDSIPENKLFEVIIIDDNSSIEIYEKLKNLAYKRVNTILLKNSSTVKGAGKCRNIGLEHATGKWLFFADSDDSFRNDFCEAITKYSESNYDLIYFIPISINSENDKEAERGSHLSEIVANYIDNPNDTNEWSMRLNFPNPWSKMIRREFVQKNKIKFDEILKSNDVMFSTKVGVLADSVTAEKISIYNWIIRKGSMTSLISKEMFSVNLEVAIDRYQYLQNNLDSKKMKSAKFNFFIFLIKSLFIYRFGILYTIKLIKNIVSVGAPLFSSESSPYKLLKKYIEAKSMTQVKR